ncbi:MAG TPA: hypothetical protein VMT87_10830 [Vicinamibacteria bacterium]|nr:hypothetical protein [Vicinamibacteria bacterium]
MRTTAWRVVVAAPVTVLALGLGTLGSGCRSAARPVPQAAGPARTDPLAGWVGKTGLLRHRGDKGKWSVKREEVRSVSGTCDVAVEVRQARFDRGTAVLTLDMIGRPRLAGRGARQERCGDDQAQIVVSVSGFEPAASTADLEAGLADVLQTPEAYLRAYSVAYELPPPPKEESPKAEASKAESQAYRIAALKRDVPVAEHHLTQKVVKVLWVDPIVRDPSGRVSHEAEVQVNAVVGWDGRIHHPKMATPLSEDHERRVLRVLPLWRFQPARRGADPAASQVLERMVFRIY